MDQHPSRLSYTQRLATFDGYWHDAEATARQLAAIGHVSDRPPLESLEEGSRCVSCSLFSPKATSIDILEGNVEASRFTSTLPPFHHPRCERLQVRLPFDSEAWRAETEGNTFDDRWRIFENDSKPRSQPTQPSRPSRWTSFFSLPAELRLQIYALVLPDLPSTVDIVQMNRDSMRVCTKNILAHPAPQDRTRCNMLRTCRQIHRECMYFLFNRTFRCSTSKVLYLFLRRIGATGRRYVQAINIMCGGREDAMTFALLACCESLSSITIRLARPTISLPRAPIWLMDGMACLLNVSGLQSVEFGDCGSSWQMTSSSHDAEIIRKELMRPRTSPGSITSVDGVLNV